MHCAQLFQIVGALGQKSIFPQGLGAKANAYFHLGVGPGHLADVRFCSGKADILQNVPSQEKQDVTQ